MITRNIVRSLSALLLISLAGCSRSVQDFYPPESASRSTLEKGLDAWKQGGSSIISDTSPAIEVLDSRWLSGQKLLGYEILESEPDTSLVWFKVRLSLEKLQSRPVVRYVVIGQDPLRVFSEEEYKHIIGM
jgi:hypothetical protein